MDLKKVSTGVQMSILEGMEFVHAVRSLDARTPGWLKKSFGVLMVMFFASSMVMAQNEIQTQLTNFFNDVIIPVGGVVVTIALFCGMAYAAVLFTQGSPKAKGILIGVFVAAIIFYGGGWILTNLLANFDSSYAIP